MFENWLRKKSFLYYQISNSKMVEKKRSLCVVCSFEIVVVQNLLGSFGSWKPTKKRGKKGKKKSEKNLTDRWEVGCAMKLKDGINFIIFTLLWCATY